MTPLQIRTFQQADHTEWRRLWTGYLEFYQAAVSEEVYATTWQRLFDPGEFEPKGFLAIVDGRPAGLVHYLYHRSCWSLVNNCYLQDLFADPDARGAGVGRALIEAVYAEADRLGAGGVYWMTQEFNAPARLLYNRVAKKTPFIKYQR